MKRIMTAAVICVLIAALSGCDNSTASVEDSSAPATQYTTELTTPITEENIVGDTSYPEEESETEATVSTTAPTTTTLTTTPENTTQDEDVQKPEWTETDIEPQVKYLAFAVYSREKAILGAPTVRYYSINDEVTVIAFTDTDYYKIGDGEYIHKDFLSDDRTVQSTTTTTSATQPPPEEVPSLEEYDGKYVSSGYPLLDSKIFPILDKLITDNMSDDDKRLAIYDYLLGYSYKDRTLLIPQSKKEYSEQIYALSLFDKGYGICYDFSSAFKFMTRALGMDTVMVYGYHSMVTGGYQEHTWVTLDIDGTTYIYDPSIELILISQGYSSGHDRYKTTYAQKGRFYLI